MLLNCITLLSSYLGKHPLLRTGIQYFEAATEASWGNIEKFYLKRVLVFSFPTFSLWVSSWKNRIVWSNLSLKLSVVDIMIQKIVC